MVYTEAMSSYTHGSLTVCELVPQSLAPTPLVPALSNNAKIMCLLRVREKKDANLMFILLWLRF